MGSLHKYIRGTQAKISKGHTDSTQFRSPRGSAAVEASFQSGFYLLYSRIINHMKYAGSKRNYIPWMDCALCHVTIVIHA